MVKSTGDNFPDGGGEAMQELGLGPYQPNHEDANGQFALNWTYADALVTADRHAFFRVMVYALAKRHGVRASFQPRPIAELTGNGAHLHCSLWEEGGRNAFHDPSGEKGHSALAYHFLAGVLEHVPALCALTNPIPSSYRRLARSITLSGATWSPAWISYGGNNRTHMVRIPDDAAGAAPGGRGRQPLPAAGRRAGGGAGRH